MGMFTKVIGGQLNTRDRTQLFIILEITVLCAI